MGITAISFDRVCELSPVISTANVLLNTFQKAMLWTKQNTHISPHSYSYHVQSKHWARQICCLVPILGNIVIFLWDSYTFSQQKEVKKEYNEATDQLNKGNYPAAQYGYKQILKSFTGTPEITSSLELNCREKQALSWYHQKEHGGYDDFLKCWATMPPCNEHLLEEQKSLVLENLKHFMTSLKNIKDEELALTYGLKLSALFERLFPEHQLPKEDSKKVPLQQHKSIMLMFIKEHPHLFNLVDQTLRYTDDFLSDALDIDPLLLRRASPDQKKNETLVIKALTKNSKTFQHADKSLRRNKTFIRKQVINANPAAFEHADETVKRDEKTVRAVVDKNYHLFKHAQPSLKRKVKFVSSLISKYPLILEYAEGNVQNHEKTVLKALKKDPEAYQFANTDLRNSVKFNEKVFIANDKALAYATKEFLNNGENAFTLTKKCGHWPFNFFSSNVRSDPVLLKRIFVHQTYALAYAALHLRDNRHLALEATAIYCSAVQFASERLKREPLFGFQAVSINGLALEHLDVELQNNSVVALAAYRNNKEAKKFIGQQALNCLTACAVFSQEETNCEETS